MKASSCVALSPDGKLLAVGEIGHQPRVFLYSTASDSSSAPLAILNEHRFGIKFVEFSPCGKFLATLGDVNDGFLHVWSLAALKETGHATLHSSNRCISTVVCLRWLNSVQLVTAGVRHLRVWTLDASNRRQPDARVLAGRNVVLGAFSTSTWVSIAPVSEDVMAALSSSGDICTIQDRQDDKPAAFTARVTLDIGLHAIDVDASSGKLWVAGEFNRLLALDLEEFLRIEIVMTSPRPSTPPDETRIKSVQQAFVAVWGVDCARALVLTNSGEIAFMKRDGDGGSVKESVLVTSHGKEVLGLTGQDDGTGKFVTWSSDHTVGLWSALGECEKSVSVNLSNDALISYACLGATAGQLIVGTTLGSVLIVDVESQKTLQWFDAHGSRVVGIDVVKNFCQGHDTMFISCSRDRTVQVFGRARRILEHPSDSGLAPAAERTDASVWELRQTLADHKGTIVAAKFARDHRHIISCSSDRTANIYSIVFNDSGDMAWVLTKVVSLKASPLDLTIGDPKTSEEAGGTFVISSDKQIQVYRDVSGELITSYRTIDDYANGSDAVSLTSISVGTLGRRVYLAGTASDRSVRMYEHPSGVYVGSDWGHSEGVSGFTWLRSSDGCKLASSGVTGCVFLWNIEQETGIRRSPSPTGFGSSPSGRASPARKILTKSELAKFMDSTPSNSAKSRPTLVNPRSPRSSPLRTALSTAESQEANPVAAPREIRLSRSPTHNAATPVLASSRNGSATSEPNGTTPLRSLSRSISSTNLRTRKSIAQPDKLPSPGRLPQSSQLTVDQLCDGLEKFRERHKRAVYTDRTKLDKLRNELTATLDAICDKSLPADGSAKGLNELARLFGREIVTIVQNHFESPASTM
jgi:WD40 repeat protein